MIEFQQVSKVFRKKDATVQALKDVSIKINKGDIFGVIGYSGAGKSTLIRLVNYLEQPTTGEVIVDGENLKTLSTSQLRTKKKKIGMVFQNFNLLESKTIFENVAMPLILSNVNRTKINSKVMELLHFVGLQDKANNYPNELSGGQKQRIGIARALASDPTILLCDEATSALDPKTTQSILNLLKQINREYGITIMLITHEMSVIQEICNRVAVMENGQVIEQGTVLDVFGRPTHPSTRYFVQTVIRNQVTESVENELVIKPNTVRIKAEFFGEITTTPILQNLMKKRIEVNILFANTTEIQDTTMMILYADITGDEDNVKHAIQYLTLQGALVEVVADVRYNNYTQSVR